jgi:hypothetical protein
MASSTINSISGIFPFKRASIFSKYLGLLLFFGKSKCATFKDILEKVSGKIEGWRAKTLSQASHTMLIKSVAKYPRLCYELFYTANFLKQFLGLNLQKILVGIP